MGHASTSCLQAGSSVNSVHAPAYEAIDHTAITATVLVACVLYDATACWRGLGIIQHHQARGTDAMSDGTRLHHSCLQAGSSVNSVHAPAYEAIPPTSPHLIHPTHPTHRFRTT